MTGHHRTLAAVTLIAIFLLLLSSPAAAHPPSAIIPAYDPELSQLSLTITHTVGGQVNHYINRVLVRTPRDQQEYRYTGQPSDTFTYTYPLDAIPGETVTCTAICSIAGSNSVVFVYAVGPSEGAAPAPVGSPVLPGPHIPILWPVHAALMATGFALMLLSAVIVTWFWRGFPWYRAHVYLAPAGGLIAVIGLSIAVSMVALSGGPHPRVLHGWIGAAAIGLILATLLLGIFHRHTGPERQVFVRSIHLWVGRVTLAVMAITIVLGLVLVGII